MSLCRGSIALAWPLTVGLFVLNLFPLFFAAVFAALYQSSPQREEEKN